MSVVPLSAQAKTFSQKLFNETFYLTNNPDVLTAVSQGLTSAFAHFSTFGHREPRPLVPFFNSSAYLLANPDLLAATTQPGWVSAWNHFVLFGILEGRSPNGTAGFTGLFDNAKYLAQNPDVNTAVTNGAFRNGFEHYLLFGSKEGRPAFTKDGTALATETPGQTLTLTTNDEQITLGAGNDVIRAVAGAPVGAQDQTTLNSGDVLDGGAGNDSLVVNLVGNYGGGATIKNIETLQIGTNVTTGVTFDYNVNQGNFEVVGVKTIIADQITFGETLTIANITPTASGANPIPALSWENEAGSKAGTLAATYRQATIEGTADNQVVTLRNVNNGRLDIGAGVETLTINSVGTAARNTLVNSGNTDTGNFNVAADLISQGSLTKVVINATTELGKPAGRDAEGLADRGAPNTDGGGDGLTGSLANLLSVGARVTQVDASASKAAVNVQFLARTDGAPTNVTFKGGQGNDYVEFEIGNVNATGGKGDDIFAFITARAGVTNSTFGAGDVIVGGEGKDTLLIGLNGKGTYTLSVSEFSGVSGVEVLDLRGENNTVTLPASLVAGVDAGAKFTVTTDNIVVGGTSPSNKEYASVNTVDVRNLNPGQGIEFLGGQGSDRLILSDATFNALMFLDGGANEDKVGNATKGDYDTLTVVGGAVIDRSDLANVKNFEGLVLAKPGPGNVTTVIELSEAFLLANTRATNVATTTIDDRVFQIGTVAAAGGFALGAGDVVRIDVTDLFNTATNAVKPGLTNRFFDFTTLTNAGATVQFVYNGVQYPNFAALVGAVPAAASLNTSDSVGQADGVQNSAAGVVVTPTSTITVTAGGNFTGTPGVNDTFVATIAALNGTTITGDPADNETLKLTTAGVVNINNGTTGGNVTNIDNLILADGTNTITFTTGSGITNITGGTGADTVNVTNLGPGVSVNLGDGNDVLTLNTQSYNGTFVGGLGADSITTAGSPNVSSATVTGFETLVFGAVHTLTVGANASLTQFFLITGFSGGSETITITAGNHNISGAVVTNFGEAGSDSIITINGGSLTINGDANFTGASPAKIDFIGTGTLITTGNLTLDNTNGDTFNGTVTFGAGGVFVTDLSSGVSRTYNGSTGNDTLVMGSNNTHAQTVNIGQGGSDIIRLDINGADTASFTVNGFQTGLIGSGGDVIDLSGTGGGNTVALTTIASASGSVAGLEVAAPANITNLVALSNPNAQVVGAFTNAQVQNAIINANLAMTSGGGHLYFALDNGTDTAIYRVQIGNGGALNTAIDSAADFVSIQQIVVLTGIADVGSLQAVNIT